MQALAFARFGRRRTAAQAQSTLPPPEVATGQAPGRSRACRSGTGNDIVITGSRIRRSPLDLNAPRVFIDQADIQKTGLNSINDVLQRLPSSAGGMNSQASTIRGNLGNPPNGGGVGAGAAEIDLRYLGPIRTLVLVDGLRFVNGASASGVPGSVDLNSIPDSMIERVEVLQDGASTIYGSDAIAGVVNIITKTGQKGFVASAQVGSYLDHGRRLDPELSAELGQRHERPDADRRRRQLRQSRRRSVGATARFRLSRTLRDRLCDGGCSSFPLNGRFGGSSPSVHGLQTLAHPITTRADFPADFRDFRRLRTGSTSRRSTTSKSR